MWRSELLLQKFYRGQKTCPICFEPYYVTRQSVVRKCWQCGNGETIHPSCFARLTKCPFCRASFLKRHVYVYFIYDPAASDEQIDELINQCHSITNGTTWHSDIDVYDGWGQMHFEGEPQNGRTIAQACRDNLTRIFISDMWVSLHDHVDESPTNAEEIVATFIQKNIQLWPMLDENTFLDMDRGGEIF